MIKKLSNAIKLKMPKLINKEPNIVKHIKAHEIQSDDTNIKYMRRD